jgi:hypothetical protein
MKSEPSWAELKTPLWQMIKFTHWWIVLIE